MFSSDHKSLYKICYSCSAENHNLYQCPYIIPAFNKDFVIQKMNYTKPQIRKSYQRIKKTKTNANFNYAKIKSSAYKIRLNLIETTKEREKKIPIRNYRKCIKSFSLQSYRDLRNSNRIIDDVEKNWISDENLELNLDEIERIEKIIKLPEKEASKEIKMFPLKKKENSKENLNLSSFIPQDMDDKINKNLDEKIWIDFWNDIQQSPIKKKSYEILFPPDLNNEAKEEENQEGSFSKAFGKFEDGNFRRKITNLLKNSIKIPEIKESSPIKSPMTRKKNSYENKKAGHLKTIEKRKSEKEIRKQSGDVSIISKKINSSISKEKPKKIKDELFLYNFDFIREFDNYLIEGNFKNIQKKSKYMKYDYSSLKKSSPILGILKRKI